MIVSRLSNQWLPHQDNAINIFCLVYALEQTRGSDFNTLQKRRDRIASKEARAKELAAAVTQSAANRAGVAESMKLWSALDDIALITAVTHVHCFFLHFSKLNFRHIVAKADRKTNACLGVNLAIIPTFIFVIFVIEDCLGKRPSRRASRIEIFSSFYLHRD